MKTKPTSYMNSYLAGFLLGLVLLSAFVVTGREVLDKKVTDVAHLKTYIKIRYSGLCSTKPNYLKL